MVVYNDLTIHQKICLKEVICNKKYRTSILGKHDENPWLALQATKLFHSWKIVLNYYFSGDINILYQDRKEVF